ncbi:MAG: VWA domain-containing protein [Ardenticatenales bacterium]|nr:VWA domain-containing protein [Ardenticatenales bacterium]
MSVVRRAAVVLAAAPVLAVALAGGRAAAQTAPPPTAEPAPGTTTLTYRLTGDWFDVPYSGSLALVRQPLDLSSGVDGTVFVLDAAVRDAAADWGAGQRRQALHVIAPDGTLQRVVELAPTGVNARRIDAAWDGALAVLGLGPGRLTETDRVLLLEPDGRLRGSWDFPGHEGNDVAALPDGRIVVAMEEDIVVIDPAGRATRRIPFAGLGIDPPEWGYEYYITRLDAASDGRLTALVYAARSCPPRELPPVTPGTPRPTATPRPSGAGSARPSSVRPPVAADRPAAVTQSELPCSRHIAVTLNAALALDAVVPLNGGHDDLAVRDGTVFVTERWQDNDILSVGALPGNGPDVRYVPAALLPGVGHRSAGNLSGISIDVAPDGAILAAWQGNDPFTLGPVRLGIPGAADGTADTTPTGLAYGDVPALTGPVRPRAISAGPEGVSILEGANLAGNASSSPERTVDVQGRYNAVQRWTLDGRLIGHWVHQGSGDWALGAANGDRGAPEDIAAVGERVYAATPGGIWLRSSLIEPAWFTGLPGVRLIAVDADETAVVALDAAGSRVVVWAPDGRAIGNWPVAAGGRAVAASDLTVGGGRVYIADTGRNRVLVRSLAGDDLGEWRAHDGPQRLDMTIDGDIVILGRGGWGLRYTTDGVLRAAWRMPGATGAKRADGTDITAGPDGSVYVTYSRVNVGSLVDRAQDVIEAAGIWRFEMSVPPPTTLPPSPDPQHCLVDVDKTASPGRVPLGAPVTVMLTVEGECPKTPVPEQILFVVDTSWSMNDGHQYVTVPPGALERARRVLVPLLGALDPSVVDVGLVTFGDGAALQMVLSDDLADMRSRILRVQADGDTRMGAGVDLAHAELNGPRRAADARRAIVIVSDGVFKDDPRPSIAAARADGIDVHALIVTTPEFTAAVRADLAAMLGADHLHLDPSPERARDVIDGVGAWLVEADPFDTLTVRDVVPANMRFVAGSAVPPAAWDAATRTLTWTLTPRPTGTRFTLTYDVVPEEVGTWPTNVEAEVVWRDVRGGTGLLRFPVPRVEVVTTRRVYLPFAVRQQCTSWSRPLDLVLVHDVSSSMAAPAADGVRTKLEVAAEAALVFLERMDPARDRVAVVAFDAEARVAAPLSGDRRAAELALAALTPGRGTRIDRGLQAAIDVVAGDPRALALPVIVLLSDGL